MHLHGVDAGGGDVVTQEGCLRFAKLALGGINGQTMVAKKV